MAAPHATHAETATSDHPGLREKSFGDRKAIGAPLLIDTKAAAEIMRRMVATPANGDTDGARDLMPAPLFVDIETAAIIFKSFVRVALVDAIREVLHNDREPQRPKPSARGH